MEASVSVHFFTGIDVERDGNTISLNVEQGLLQVGSCDKMFFAYGDHAVDDELEVLHLAASVVVFRLVYIS